MQGRLIRGGLRRPLMWLLFVVAVASLLTVLGRPQSYGRSATAGALWHRKPAASPPPPPPGVERIALVALYAGTELPWFANYFVESCGAQRPGIVDCIILQVLDDPAAATRGVEPPPVPAALFACRRPDDDLPANVRVLSASLSAFWALVLERTGLQMSSELPDPRKLADLKPLLGEVLAEPWLRPYTAWGWVDLDCVLGDVAAFADAAAALTAASGDAAYRPSDGISLTGWPSAHSGALPWDVWSSSFEGQSSGLPLSGQFTLLRNTGALAGLWRHVPTEASPATQGMHPLWSRGAYSREEMESPWFRNFDEIGVGSAARALSNTSAPPAFDAGDATGVDDAPPTRHLRVLRTVDGLSDHLSVCVEGAGGGGGVKIGTPVQFRYWWQAGRLFRQHACGSVVGGRGADGPVREGLFFHFMCSKWSAAFWANETRVAATVNDATGVSDGDTMPSDYGLAHVPARLLQQCRVRGGGRWHESRWNLTFTADASAIRYVGGDVAPSSTPPLPLNSRHVPEAALFTFHDPLWDKRPLRGCDRSTPAAPRYGLPARELSTTQV